MKNPAVNIEASNPKITEKIGLRKKAEQLLLKKRSAAPPSAAETINLLRNLENRQAQLEKQNTELLSKDSKITLLHELEVQKVELEIQNEELLLIRAQLEETISEYQFLYNNLPSGCYTLKPDGCIIDLNPSGIAMLAKEKHSLVNSNFRNYIASNTKAVFNDFISKVFKSSTKQTCEVILANEGLNPLLVQLEGIITSKGSHCLVIAFYK